MSGAITLKYRLSKSGYCKGIQCPKILWLDSNMPELAENVIPQHIVETGIRVGELARSYFGTYSLVEFSSDQRERIDETNRLISLGEPNIAEASFTYDLLFCSVDILHRTKHGWDIVEVKSSTSISDVYIDDMAFQYFVLKNCGINIDHVYNLHINNQYERKGELDLKGLFVMEDCTEAVINKYDEVADNIEFIRDYVSAPSEPEKDIDCCCDTPYTCGYKAYCGRYIPKESVFDLSRMNTKKKYALYHEGIVSYEDILRNADRINDYQRRQIESILYNKPDEYKLEEIESFLSTLTYPIYHLDFETFQQAVPEFEGCHPYEQIPFQYSLHIEHEDGTLEHKEFLAKGGVDSRRELAERLIKDIPMNVCTTAYNMSFEKKVIKRLAQMFPDLSQHLMNIYNNICDLMIPFQKHYYYSAAMRGSYSIKYVLPALWPNDPELDYHALEGVHNGMEASLTFADMVNHTPEEIAEMRKNLLKYCELDTYAMVKVLKKLKETVGNTDQRETRK